MRRWFAKRSSASPSAEGSSPSGGGAPAFAASLAGLRYGLGPAHRGHVESWFLKANDPRADRALWLKWTLWAGDRAPDQAVAEAWAIAFDRERGHVAVKNAVPFEQARFERARLGAAIDGCTLTSERAAGRVESGGRAVAYDLAITGAAPPLVHYPFAWMYSWPLPEHKLVSPVPSARVSGTAEVEGVPWTVDGWPAMVGHNWGTGHTEVYAWGHCNAWDGGEDVVIEGASGRVRVGGVLLPAATLVCARDADAAYDVNGLASIARSEGEITTRRWRFRVESRGVEIRGEMWADTEDMVGLHYPNPDGTMCHCLGSELARAEVTLRVEGRPPRALRSSRAALEIGVRDEHHGVRMRL